MLETAQICSFLQLLHSVTTGQRFGYLRALLGWQGWCFTPHCTSQSLPCTSIFSARGWEQAGKGRSCCENTTVLPSTAVFPWLHTHCMVLVCIAFSHPADSQHHTLCWEGLWEHPGVDIISLGGWGRTCSLSNLSFQKQFWAVTPCYVYHNHLPCKILSGIKQLLLMLGSIGAEGNKGRDNQVLHLTLDNHHQE